MTPSETREGLSPLQPINPAASGGSVRVQGQIGISSKCLPMTAPNTPTWKPSAQWAMAGSGAAGLRFTSQLHHCNSTSYLTALCLSFPICETGIIKDPT